MRTIPILAALLVAAACTKHDTGTTAGPHATILTRDGNRYTGMVMNSSPTQVTLTGDDSATHTLAMKDVKSINYDDAPAAQAGSAAPVASAPPPAAPAPAATISHEDHYHPQESAIRTKTYRLPAGTEIAVRVEETIDSAKAAEAQTYAAEVAKDVHDDAGDLVIPRGANAQVVIRSAAKGGRFHGASDLVLDLDSVSIDGRQYRLSTTDIVAKGRDGVGVNKRTAEFTGGGAAVGAIIGAIAGGGKAAAIGAGSGAGGGALTQVLTKGGSIKVPAESLLTFKLDKPLRVVAQ